MSDLPILCTLSEQELQERRRDILGRVRVSAIRATELPAGFAYEFPAEPEVLAMLGRLIAFEHDCCKFLTFRVDLPAGQATAILEVTGPPESKAVIADFLGGEK
jgi:hypothetical protein